MNVTNIPTLKNPVAVFDAGIGSYDIVRTIHERYPKQDIIYLADRKSFPYGSKSKEELFDVIRAAIDFLHDRYAPEQIIVASNVPSINLMPKIKAHFSQINIHGVKPPIEEAARLSHNTSFGIMGVASMVHNQELRNYAQDTISKDCTAHFINASPLIDGFVENGKFANAPQETLIAVQAFMQDVRSQYELTKIFTLSSTHLPWLRSYFEQAAPDCIFIDPAEAVINSIQFNDDGTGSILGITTENHALGLSQSQINNTLQSLGETIQLELCEL